MCMRSHTSLLRYIYIQGYVCHRTYTFELLLYELAPFIRWQALQKSKHCNPVSILVLGLKQKEKQGQGRSENQRLANETSV